MTCKVFLTLNNGVKMPVLGFGTWQATDNVIEEALNTALKAGYRHIDTAALYDNEEVIGKVLKSWFDAGKLNRQDVFVTTKLSPHDLHPDKVEERLTESLKKLQLDYVDLYLIHFPICLGIDEAGEYYGLDVDYVDVWKKMEEQHDAGRTRTIGVSNFSVKKLERLLTNCRVKPTNNQIEAHVYMQQRELINFCTENGITVVVYAPLGSRGYFPYLAANGFERFVKELPDILTDKTVASIAHKHSKTPAQILLRFSVQLGVAPIPKSCTPSRIKENIDIFNFGLDEEDMAKLYALEVGPEARIFKHDVFGRACQHPYFEF